MIPYLAFIERLVMAGKQVFARTLESPPWQERIGRIHAVAEKTFCAQLRGAVPGN